MKLRLIADSFADKSKRTQEVIDAARSLGSVADRIIHEKLVDPVTRDWANTLLGLGLVGTAEPKGYVAEEGDFLLFANWPNEYSYLVVVGALDGDELSRLDILELDKERFTSYSQFWARTRNADAITSAFVSKVLAAKITSEKTDAWNVIRYAFAQIEPTRMPSVADNGEDSIEFLIPYLRVAALLEPGDPEHSFSLGNALLACDRYREGLDALLIASKDPDLRVSCLWHAGNAALRMGEHRRGRSLFIALTRQEDCPAHYMDFATAFLDELELVGEEEPKRQKRHDVNAPPPWSPNWNELFG